MKNNLQQKVEQSIATFFLANVYIGNYILIRYLQNSWKIGIHFPMHVIFVDKQDDL